jgi:Carboxypeptidase regulatory-like domain
MRKSVLQKVACLLFMMMLTGTAFLAFAQTPTTGALIGAVSDQTGATIPGVSISAVHDATGTRYETVSGDNGRYQISNIRPGPYTVTAQLPGFKDQTQKDVLAQVGESVTIDFKLTVAGVTQDVSVVADTSMVQTDVNSSITTSQIQSLPTIARSITDIARTNPLFNPTTLGSSGDAALSVAGRHNRYNNMQIDGAVNNDLFGLADSGTPGGQTGTQPISLDAISEFQLVVAPYDVKQGGFSGGGLNIITKSGTNAFHGTGYYFARNQNLIGAIPGIATVATPSPVDTLVGKFTDKQGGFSLGGPIVKNNAFFFTNLDWARKNTPVGFSLSGNSGQPWGVNDVSLAQQALAFIQQQYGFSPGGIDEFSRPNNSNKFFGRGDFNLNTRNQLVVRTNYVKGLADIGTPTTSQYLLPDRFYSIQDKVLSQVGQLNTTLSATAFNEFRVTYQRERNVRGDQPGFKAFPMVRVDFPDGNNMILGTENSSQANKLNQDIVEVNDDLTWIKGRHTLTLGTHNEFFKFYNLFIQNLYGNYEFAAGPAADPLANLKSGLAQAYSHNFSNYANNPLFPAQFSVQQYGFYVGDKWLVAPRLTLTYGLRFETPHFPNTPKANPVAVTDFNFRTDVVPAPKMWSPRVGFSWNMDDNPSSLQKLSGGVGIFAGRTPYVWLSNQYGNTGVDFTSISVGFATANKIPFSPDPNNQPVNVGTAGRQTLNLIDPNYKYPQLLRGNLEYERSLGFLGLTGSAEFLWSKTLKDIMYKNLNWVSTGTRPDGRLAYQKLDPNLNDALFLTNAKSGDTETAVFKIERRSRGGVFFSGSYLYNRARSVSDGGAFVALTTWRDQYVTKDVNNPTLARSIYEAGNRVNFTGSVPIPLVKGLQSTASFFYNGQTGQPYSLVFNGDANGDTGTTNDIAFIPATQDQVVVQNGTWAQLDAFLSKESGAKNNRGMIPNRNAGTSPWHNGLDFRYAVRVPVHESHKVELTLDMFNLLNRFNKNWGWTWYPNFNSPTTLGYGGIDPSGKEIINASSITNPNFLGVSSRDDLRSRWQAQWGVRYSF